MKNINLKTKTVKITTIIILRKKDFLVIKKDIKKDDIIKLDDVELNLPKEVVEARDYQYNLI